MAKRRRDDERLERAFRALLARCGAPNAIRQSLQSLLQAGDALRLRSDARLAVGERSSDLPLRLFHLTKRNGDFESAEALAETLAAALQLQLQLQSKESSPQAEDGGVSVVGVAVVSLEQAERGLPSDRLVVKFRERARVRARREDDGELRKELKIRFVHLDDAVAVVDKPSGVLSVDGTSVEAEPSVHAMVRERFPDARMVHRLDLETSGLLVVALTRSAAQHLNRQFRERTVSKTYLARVLGRVDWPREGKHIRLPMERDPDRKLLQRVVTEREVAPDSSMWSVTDAKTIELGDDSSLVELKPETGKTHQLRVHMLHSGHPILGDSLYAPERVEDRAPMLCLHAARLSFAHPESGEILEFASPCPF